jgi:hypothetical protein
MLRHLLIYIALHSPFSRYNISMVALQATPSANIYSSAQSLLDMVSQWLLTMQLRLLIHYKALHGPFSINNISMVALHATLSANIYMLIAASNGG